MKTKDRDEWVNGLKGIACLFIMMGHFTGLYKYADNIHSFKNTFLDMIVTYPVSIITSESFWLFLFFPVSGYCLAKSAERSLKDIWDVLYKVMIRGCRFVLPIMGTALLVLCIGYCIGFHNQEIASLVDNNWLASAYNRELNIGDAIQEPFLVLLKGVSLFNSPYWCIKSMFIASVLVYLLVYCKKKCEEKNIKHCEILIGILALFVFGISGRTAILAHVFGMLLAWCEDIIYKHTNKYTYVYLLAAIAPLIVFLVNGSDAWVGLSFCLLMLAVNNIKYLKYCVEKLGGRIGKISWGIFSYHWPVFNSVGMLLFLNLNATSLNKGLVFGIVFVVCIIITIFMAIISYYTVERITSAVCLWLQNIYSKKKRMKCS